MSRIVFSAAAREDRRSLAVQSVEQFGLQQARRFRDRMHRVLTLLAEQPLLGRLRPELDPPGFMFRYFVVMRRFIIVYEPIAGGGIKVVRMLHGLRNLAAELYRESGE